MFIKQLYASDSSISGPATDADPALTEYKDVLMLQGDEQTVDIGTNFNDGGTATDVNEVTLGGNDYVVRYGNSGGHIQIVPEEPIDVAGLTTLHMSVYGGNTFTTSRPDGGADLVKLVYEAHLMTITGSLARRMRPSPTSGTT